MAIVESCTTFPSSQKVLLNSTALEKRIYQTWGKVSEDDGTKARKIIKSYKNIATLNYHTGQRIGEELQENNTVYARKHVLARQLLP